MLAVVWHLSVCIALYTAVWQGALDLSPHLWVLPAELAPFRELLSALGVLPAFAPSQYRCKARA